MTNTNGSGRSHSPTSPADFHYFEIAAGSLNYRNTIVDADTEPAPIGKTEYYRSVYLHSKELADYTATNLIPDRNGKLHPSVKGYAGAVLAEAVHFDIDHVNLSTALTWARLLIRRLHYEYDVPLEAIRCAFSGKKGFDIRVPASLFGGFAPGVDVPDRMKRLALALVDGLDITLDGAVYDRTRVFRELNTVHARSGLHKIPLTAEEVLALDIAAITDLATTPREIPTTPDDEWLPRPGLAALWEATEQPATPPSNFVTPPEPRDAPEGQARAIAVAIIAAAWPTTGRHQAGLALAGGLARAGWKADPIRDFVADVAVKAMGQEGADRHAAGEWEREANDSVAKAAKGKHVVGWPSLAELIGDVAVAAVRQVLGLNKPKAHVHVRIGEKRVCGCADEVPSEAPESDKARARREAKERRRRVQYARFLKRERDLRALIRDPSLSPGDKVHTLVMRDTLEAWERKPSANGEYRLYMQKKAEACGTPRSTFKKRVDDLAAKTNAYRVRRQTLKVPAIDVRSGKPIMNQKTGRQEVWRETQVFIKPEASSATFVDAVLGRTNMPDPEAARQRPKYRARGLSCRKHPNATIIMETRILRYCSVCKESVAEPIKRERELAPDVPAGGVLIRHAATPDRSTPETPRYTVVNLSSPSAETARPANEGQTRAATLPLDAAERGIITSRAWVAAFKGTRQILSSPPEGGTLRVLSGPSMKYMGMKPPAEVLAEYEAVGGDA